MSNQDEDFQFPENEGSSCEHCELKYSRVHELMHEFIALNKNENVSVEDFVQLFAEFYDEAYDDGEKEAYENISSFALDMVHGHQED